MAKWVFTVQGFTPVAVADNTNYTDLGYMGLMGGSTTQRIDISEVRIDGLAAAAAATPMVLARDSTVQVTPTGLTAGLETNAALDPATAALAAPQIAFTASTTKPKRSTTLAKLALGLNAFGGIALWQAPPGLNQEFRILGNTAALGEASLSCYTGGSPGLVMAHIIYEPL